MIGTRGYARIQSKFERDECVILDGAMGTELERQARLGASVSDSCRWNFDLNLTAPSLVRSVHRAYLEAGADIVTTNSYGVLDAPGRRSSPASQRGVDWLESARRSVLHARHARGENHACVAFSIGGDVRDEFDLETIQVLADAFERVRPDLVLFETLSFVGEHRTYEAIEVFINRNIPVWASFRRAKEGVCGIHGNLWGGPEGDRFGRIARSLERIGVSALLLNCLPVDRLDGTVSWLRDYSGLPLGIYPNIGRYRDPGWAFDPNWSADDFAELARCWRAEGASVIGGCCGVGPEDIRAASAALVGLKAGGGVAGSAKDNTCVPTYLSSINGRHGNGTWSDADGVRLFPLSFPELIVEPGVFRPTQGSYLVWKTLFRNKIGRRQRCLDVGCGAGVLAIQLALNGAESVLAIDIERAAVANTLSNAFRNGVADRVQGDVVDLYAFSPTRPFDCIVASLYQMPTNPEGRLSGHRPVDYWGRNLVDELISRLPEMLSPDGRAYLMQISLLGERETCEQLERHALDSRVIDFGFHAFSEVFLENLEQIESVEKLSDAYHFRFAGEHVMVMYLIEITPCARARESMGLLTGGDAEEAKRSVNP